MKNSELSKAAHGCLNVIALPNGYTAFRRFTSQQMAEYSRNYLFKTLSQCPSGVYLALKTNGTELSFKVSLEPGRIYVSTLAGMSLEEWKSAFSSLSQSAPGSTMMGMKDDFDVLVKDDRCVSARLKKGRITIPLGRRDGDGILPVKLYLPVFPFVAICDVDSDGEVWPDMDSQNRRTCYCFGDSITQGFNAHSPSRTYVSILGRKLDMEMLNFGIGGYYFEADSLAGMESLPKPDMVIVAYGTNDWAMLPSLAEFKRKAAEYFRALSGLYSGIPTYVLTPIWRGDMHELNPPMGSFEAMCEALKEEAGLYSDNRIIDGLSFPMHDRGLFGDRFLHPNAAGFTIMADCMAEAITATANPMAAVRCSSLETFN